MGHSEITSTQIYDIVDENLARMQIEFANRHIFLPGSPQTIAEYQRTFLTKELAHVEQVIAQEKKENSSNDPTCIEHVV